MMHEADEKMVVVTLGVLHQDEIEEIVCITTR